jgi:RNA polymerase sigma-70 factor (subfamily 1)
VAQVEDAVAKEADRPGEFLEGYRSYLALLARVRLPRWLRRWLDPTDVVHQTLAKAHPHQDRLQDMPPARMAAYLRQVLQNVLRDEVRRHWRERPDKPLEDGERSSSLFWPLPCAAQPSPSEQVMHEELLVELGDALARLSERERTAVEMRYLRVPRCSLEKIGQELGCTERAAGGVLCRALQKLRQLLRKSQL